MLSFLKDLFWKKSWQAKLRDAGYKKHFTVQDMVDEIFQYDPENGGVVFSPEGRLVVASIKYNVKPGRSNEAIGFAHLGWEGKGQDEEEAVGSLLLKFLRKYGPVGWDGLLEK